MTEPENRRARARSLRRAATEAERTLWWHLRRKLPLEGTYFRRQAPLGPHFADFCCLKHRLVIELDGGQHGTPEGLAADAVRTRYLQQSGSGYCGSGIIRSSPRWKACWRRSMPRLPATLTPFPSPQGRGESAARDWWSPSELLLGSSARHPSPLWRGAGGEGGTERSWSHFGFDVRFAGGWRSTPRLPATLRKGEGRAPGGSGQALTELWLGSSARHPSPWWRGAGGEGGTERSWSRLGFDVRFAGGWRSTRRLPATLTPDPSPQGRGESAGREWAGPDGVVVAFG